MAQLLQMSMSAAPPSKTLLRRHAAASVEHNSQFLLGQQTAGPGHVFTPFHINILLPQILLRS